MNIGNKYRCRLPPSWRTPHIVDHRTWQVSTTFDTFLLRPLARLNDPPATAGGCSNWLFVRVHLDGGCKSKTRATPIPCKGNMEWYMKGSIDAGSSFYAARNMMDHCP